MAGLWQHNLNHPFDGWQGLAFSMGVKALAPCCTKAHRATEDYLSAWADYNKLCDLILSACDEVGYYKHAG